AQYRGHLQLRPEHGLAEGDRQDVYDVVAVADEARVLLYLEHDQDVPPRPSARPDAPLATQRNIVVRRDTGRDLHLDGALDPLAAIAVAGRAGIDDLLAGAPAGRARSGADELTENTALYAPDLTHAPARGAGLRAAGRRRPCARTTRAGVEQPHFDPLLRAG